MVLAYLLFVFGIASWQYWYGSVPLTINEGIYATIGQALGAGKHLYQDIWDHKPPLVFGLYALALRVFPDVEVASRALAGLAQALTGLFLALIAQRLGASRQVLRWVLGLYLVLLLPPQLQTWSAQADSLMLPFLLAAFWVALHPDRSAKRAALAGALWALAFLVKQTALFFLPLFFLAPVALKDRGQWFLVGLNAVVIPLAVPFFLNGSNQLWAQAVWGANFAYVAGGWQAWLTQAESRAMTLDWLWRAALVYLPFLVAAVLGWRGRAPEDALEGAGKRWAWAWLGLGALSCAASGKFFNYYAVALLPPLAYLVAVELGKEGASGGRRWATLGLAAVCASFLLVRLDEPLALKQGQYSLERMGAARAAGVYIKANAKPGQALWVRSYESQIYAYAAMQPCCSRYFVRDHRLAMGGEEAQANSRLNAAGLVWVVDQALETSPSMVSTTAFWNLRLSLVDGKVASGL